MVQKAMHFTPEVMLSAPRRSTGVPNALGTKVLYTTSSYNFKTHSKTSELHVLEVKSGACLVLAKDEDISDLNCLDDAGTAFVCLQSGANGGTNVCIGDATWTVRPDDAWSKRHYVAGTIDAPAGNLKIVRLDEEGREFAFVVSAQAKKDGCLFNPEKAKKTHSTGRLYDSLYVRHWDSWVGKERNALWYVSRRSGLRGFAYSYGRCCPFYAS